MFRKIVSGVPPPTLVRFLGCDGASYRAPCLPTSWCTIGAAWESRRSGVADGLEVICVEILNGATDAVEASTFTRGKCIRVMSRERKVFNCMYHTFMVASGFVKVTTQFPLLIDIFERLSM